MDKAKGGMFEGERHGWVGWGGGRGRVKMETIVIKQYEKKVMFKSEKN